MDAGLASGEDDEFRSGSGGLVGQLASRSLTDLLGDELRMPGGRRVTPSALHRATLQADEKGFATEMDTLPLPTEENRTEKKPSLV